MSAESASAMKAALQEVGAAPHWMMLHQLLEGGGGEQADGAASSFSPAAREEAARKLISNHVNVLRDVCNPSPSHNIIGTPLTQTELTRVGAAHVVHVDEALRETARRLLGRRPGAEQLKQGDTRIL